MKNTDCKEVRLVKGLVQVYGIEKTKLHAYNTNDAIGDTVFILEKNGKALIIEQPCFFDNIKELAEYVDSAGLKIKAKMLAYHMAGGSFLPEIPVYATTNAENYTNAGGGKSLIANFTQAFGETFDPSVSKVTDIIETGPMEVSAIQANIIKTSEAYDIEFPESNIIYTHMLGADTHSIIAGKDHADALIKQLNGFIDKKYKLILSSHHMPETLDDVKVKIAYIEDIKKIAAESKNAEEFKTAAKKQFADYHGENYLDMTTGFFFPSK